MRLTLDDSDLETERRGTKLEEIKFHDLNVSAQAALTQVGQAEFCRPTTPGSAANAAGVMVEYIPIYPG